MAGAKPERSKSENADAELNTTEQKEERDLSEATTADEETREQESETEVRHEEQDLNQGMQTGTYDDSNPGIDWPADYRLRKPRKEDEPKKSDS
jgi:hypothetical protein